MIEWLIQRAEDDPRVARGVPPRDLLSDRETVVYEGLTRAKRRGDWLLGRWTAKRLLRAVAQLTGEPWPANNMISILAAQDGAPEIWLAGRNQLQRCDTMISISHAHGVSLCAAGGRQGILLGVDIEAIAPRPERFFADYFSESEQALVHQTRLGDRDRLITAIWSGKESALKAIRQGLHMDTRMVTCDFSLWIRAGGLWPASTANWHPFAVHWHNSQPFPALDGWWRTWNNFVLTMAIGRQ